MPRFSTLVFDSILKVLIVGSTLVWMALLASLGTTGYYFALMVAFVCLATILFVAIIGFAWYDDRKIPKTRDAAVAMVTAELDAIANKFSRT